MLIDKIAALRKTVLFGQLETKELQALAERAGERHLGQDEILFIAGEEAHGLYIIVSGAVRAFRRSPDGREQVIHVEYPGATIAEVPVFDDQPYPSTIAAQEDAVLLFLDKRDVRRLCLQHPTIALAALKVMAGRLRKCSDLVEALALREVGQRLARFLLSEITAQGIQAKTEVTLQLRLNNQQIAARVGSVREVVSRAFARLQQAGLIAMSGRKVTIHNVEVLKSYAGEY